MAILQRARLVAVLLVSLASPAVAQTTDRDDPRKDAKVHVGPLYLTPTVSLRDLGIDTNVFNQSLEQHSDFTFTLAPRLELWVPIARRALIKTTATGDVVWYQRYSSERSVNPGASARAELYFNRLTLFGGGSYLDSRQRPNYEIDLRSRRVEQAYEAGVEVSPSPRFAIEFATREHTTEFDADAMFLGTSLRQVLNRDSRELSATSRYRVTPLTTIVVRGSAIEERFPFAAVRNSDSLRIVPGVEFKPKALVSGTAYVGVCRLQALDDRLPDYQGVVASLGLAYTLLGSTTFGVTWDRDVDYSIEATQPYFVAQSVGATIRRHLAGRFDVTVGAARIRYAYRDILTPESVGTASGDGRLDRTKNYSGSLGYRLGRGMRLGVGASYWKRESNAQILRNYDGLRIGTSLTYGF